MADLWYALVAFTLIAFVVLDGYDWGAGMLHLFVAKTDDERRAVIAAIGPYWDGNEVWLLAAGGALFLAFPTVLAAGMSGFYFAIILLIWCLIGRGVSLEVRSHANDPLWRGFWDVAFAGTSTLLAIFFGCALGNVVRGVPLSSDGWFTLPLFTDFSAGAPAGILDAYTLLVGLFAIVVLVAHGGAFLALRTEGAVHERSRRIGGGALIALVFLWIPVTWATARVRPELFHAFATRPLAWTFVALAAAGVSAAFLAPRRGAHRLAYFGTSAFVLGQIAVTATCLHPMLLPGMPDPSRSLTTLNAAAPESGLRFALAWFIPGIALAIAYRLIVERLHRAKASGTEYGSH
jgi:cytochrome d ubiquinol oxidase subunit II